MIYNERNADRVEIVSNPAHFPDITDGSTSKVKSVLEPVVKATIIAPDGKLYTAPIALRSAEGQSRRVSW